MKLHDDATVRSGTDGKEASSEVQHATRERDTGDRCTNTFSRQTTSFARTIQGIVTEVNHSFLESSDRYSLGCAFSYFLAHTMSKHSNVCRTQQETIGTIQELITSLIPSTLTGNTPEVDVRLTHTIPSLESLLCALLVCKSSTIRMKLGSDPVRRQRNGIHHGT